MCAAQVKAVFGIKETNCFPRGSIDFSVLTDIEQVASIAAEWDDLLAKSRCNRTFNCSKWYLATVELNPKLQPLVFTARRDGVLSGILPLWLDVDKKLAGIGDNFIDHSDIIAADEDAAVMVGLLDLALKGAGGYERLFLGQVRRDSNYVTAAKALGLGERVDEFFQPGNPFLYAVVDLTGGYNRYMKTLSRGFRRNLYRMCKKAERDGLIIRELTPAELQPDVFPEIFLSLHLSRFGDRSSIKSSEVWMRRLFPSLFSGRQMRVFAILEKDRIVAIDLETVSRSGMYGFNGGFLPQIQKYAPGKLLIHKVIQQCCLEGMADYDFGWWGQDYKADWKPGTREVARLQFATYSKTHDTQKFNVGIESAF
jgi:CelD/BcsL family acetyltransferase involved in cellulose biosynthesis